MKQQIANQFLGVLDTPALWTGCFHGISQFNLPAEKGPDPAQVENRCPSLSKVFVLGKRVELFIRAFLENAKGMEVLASTIQISRDKITLGEIDFLLRDLEQERNIHMELVFKIYLYDPDIPGDWESWTGPNRKDSLAQKLRKLKEKQFPLLFQPQTRALLVNLGLVPEHLVQQSCFKALLFLPLHGPEPSHHFNSLNRDCVAGYWIRADRFTRETYGTLLFFPPVKQDWPIHPSRNQTWYTFPEIQDRIAETLRNQRAPLLWVKGSDTSYQRLFVVWW